MFISHQNGSTTSTIRVNTGADMLLALLLIVTGIVFLLAALRNPMLHFVALTTGVGLVWIGCILARRTSRLIGLAKRAYEEGTRR